MIFVFRQARLLTFLRVRESNPSPFSPQGATWKSTVTSLCFDLMFLIVVYDGIACKIELKSHTTCNKLSSKHRLFFLAVFRVSFFDLKETCNPLNHLYIILSDCDTI